MYFVCQRARQYFFFQAEDGIQDHTVTGVQTCALPISKRGRGFRYPRSSSVPDKAFRRPRFEIGRASCRERVYISVVAVSLKKKESCARREVVCGSCEDGSVGEWGDV